MKKRMNISLQIKDCLRGEMKDTNEPLRIYVAVDSTKVFRCRWCGSAESDAWFETQYGTFCSGECYDASQAYDRISVYSCFLIIFVGSFAVMETLWPGTLIIALPAYLLLSSPYLCCVKESWDSRKRIPRNSRKDTTSLDLSLLKAMTSGVLCPRCSANIDIRKVGKDKVYNCEYCGASGTIELVKTP